MHATPDFPEPTDAMPADSVATTAAQDAVAAGSGPTPDATIPPSAAPIAGPKDISPAACADLLKQHFPALFGGPPKPLKLRIQADINLRAPGVFGKPALSAFFRRYTGSTGYLLALGKATQRFDLDGQPAGELSEEHRNLAREELARRRQVTREREQQARAAQAARAAQSAGPAQAAQAEPQHPGAGLDQAHAPASDPLQQLSDQPVAPQTLPGQRAPQRGRQAHPDRPPHGRPPRRPTAPHGAAQPAQADGRPGPSPQAQHRPPARPSQQPMQAQPPQPSRPSQPSQQPQPSQPSQPSRQPLPIAHPPPPLHPAELAEQAAHSKARQERLTLLRDFERTTLTMANFCVLKRLTPEALKPQLDLARKEAAEHPPQRAAQDRYAGPSGGSRGGSPGGPSGGPSAGPSAGPPGSRPDHPASAAPGRAGAHADPRREPPRNGPSGRPSGRPPGRPPGRPHGR